MRTILASVLSTAVLVAFTGTDIASAASKTKKKRSNCDTYCQRYPSATERQLKNARAYDRGGEYYEQDPNAHPVGSRGWWYLKERDGGGLRF